MTQSEWPPRKVICTGVVVLRDEKVLLVRQAEGHSLAGQWSIPWSIVEANEQPEITAVRETKEETGQTGSSVASFLATTISFLLLLITLKNH